MVWQAGQLLAAFTAMEKQVFGVMWSLFTRALFVIV
jgi:hypothetical protein